MRIHTPKSYLSGSYPQSNGLMSDYYGRICSAVGATSNDILFDPIRHIASEKIGVKVKRISGRRAGTGNRNDVKMAQS